MKMLKKLYILGFIAILTGCQSDLLDRAPYHGIQSGQMWVSEEHADEAVMGVYNILLQSHVGMQLFAYDALGVSAENRDEDALNAGKATVSNSRFLDSWKQFYEGIYRANNALENLNKTAITAEKLSRLMSEVRFLRAYFYYRLVIVHGEVPLYTDVFEPEELIKKREPLANLWKFIIDELTLCINDPNLPGRSQAGTANFGRVTKSAAYALRGKAYLWQEMWPEAQADFEAVGTIGHELFRGAGTESYKMLFKEANEQSPEMIFSVQCIGMTGYGNEISFRYGSRSTFGSCWNTYLVNSDFVESYENADGSPFNWDDYLPGYNAMTPAQRTVFFLRDNLTAAEIATFTKNGADMSKYLANGNEARIKAVYENRDPRLMQTIITPYSTYIGYVNNVTQTVTLRWPYRNEAIEPFDLRTDTNAFFYYLFRKFVAEGGTEIPNRSYSPIDFPLIRYADVLLNLAEALNEQGDYQAAIAEINKVRERAGIALLQYSDASLPTYVSGPDEMRERIRNERRWEMAGEGVNYFDELRWKTLKDTKFTTGLKQIWGQVQRANSWGGDHYYNWPIPKDARDMNKALTQNPGWIN